MLKKIGFHVWKIFGEGNHALYDIRRTLREIIYSLTGGLIGGKGKNFQLIKRNQYLIYTQYLTKSSDIISIFKH